MGKKEEYEVYAYNGTFEISSRPSTKIAAYAHDTGSLEETNELLEELTVDK